MKMKGNISILLLLAFVITVNSTSEEWDNFKWISSNNIMSNLDRLVPLGVADDSGEAVLFCRTKYARTTHFHPGKFTVRDGQPTCTITGNGRVHVKTSDFEVLYTPEGWVQWAPGNGDIPEYAFAVGTDAGSGRYTHLGRVRHNGKEILGRVRGHRCFFTDGDSGRSVSSEDYDVLILTFAARRRNRLSYAPY